MAPTLSVPIWTLCSNRHMLSPPRGIHAMPPGLVSHNADCVGSTMPQVRAQPPPASPTLQRVGPCLSLQHLLRDLPVDTTDRNQQEKYKIQMTAYNHAHLKRMQHAKRECAGCQATRDHALVLRRKAALNLLHFFLQPCRVDGQQVTKHVAK